DFLETTFGGGGYQPREWGTRAQSDDPEDWTALERSFRVRRRAAPSARMAAGGRGVESPRGACRRPYAPSPPGMIHAGNARPALAAWLSARSQGGAFVWRLEDLDPPRVVPGMAEAQMEDLAWLGLDWDEGPDVGGPFAPYAQSQRSAVYEEALRRL